MEKKRKGSGVVLWSVLTAIFAILLAAVLIGTYVAYGSFRIALHGPVTMAAADLIQKVAQHIKAALGMVYFGVELNPIEFSFFVAYHCTGTLRSVPYYLKSLRKTLYVIIVAHPCYGF